MKKRIAIFASGTGSNAERFMEHFKASALAEVVLILSNNTDAGVLQKAKRHEVRTVVVSNKEAASGEGMTALMKQHSVDFIVLAGYMRLIPIELTRAYDRKMVNIHPSLLPKYGGKGMYGGHVHEAVIAAGEAESGITIHYVNEVYDDGEVLFQTTCNVDSGDNADALAQKIHALEHQHYPVVVEKLLTSL